MRRIVYTLPLAAGLAASCAMAADLTAKAFEPPPPAPSPWDVAITAGLMTDYYFRGVTQSAHKPSTEAGFETRYDFASDWQAYAGLSGESIDFPNRAAAEIDFYGGIRPTLDKLALDFGAWYYYYPAGQCFNASALCNGLGGGPAIAAVLPNGNVVKANESFYEVYAEATYTVNENLSVGLQEWYSPSVLNSGAAGLYTVGNIVLTAPAAWFADGLGAYISGDGGYWKLGTTDAFYAVPGFPAGIPYASYWNWDAGLGFTWKSFTLDLRYYGSNLSKADCNAFTSDHTATGVATSAINPAPLPGSNWCSAAYIAKLSFETNLGGAM
jgi:uncharacterized protein (TIGR02001 family)